MIIIEEAKSTETREIRQVLRDTWIETYTGHLSPMTIETIISRWHTDDHLLFQINDPSILFTIARGMKGNIVGLATVREDFEDAIYMSRLYVLPLFHGQGIGTKLLENAISKFPAAKVIRLSVERMNLKAILFYFKCGFTKTEESKLQIDDEIIQIIEMERVL